VNPANPESASRSRIAIFGGTFDPVHKGHLLLAEWIADNLHLDGILFIPIRIHPFSKRQDITRAEHRLNMLRLAIAGYNNFEVSSVELEREGVSYTVDTLRSLHRRKPDTEFYFLIGDDNLSEFHKWKEPDEIRKLARIVVFRRGGQAEINKKKYPDFIYVDNPLIDISSSEIRERLKRGLPLEDQIPPAVLDYIRQHRLYLIQ